METPQHGGRRTRLVATIAAVVLGVSGVAAVGVGVSRQQPAPAAPPAASSPSRQAEAPSSAPPSGAGRVSRPAMAPAHDVPLLDYAEPERVTIPSIGVDSRLVDLGLDSAGMMETPVPVEVAGWFTPSPPPGVGGATVLAGHVTWDQQPTVFFKLGELRKGDKVSVTREDGARVTYEVYRIGSFPKDSFPTDEVYGQPGRSELRLITCGGDYDEASKRYLDNVIVWAGAVAVDRS